jgi:hypothetical protein
MDLRVAIRKRETTGIVVVFGWKLYPEGDITQAGGLHAYIEQTVINAIRILVQQNPNIRRPQTTPHLVFICINLP